jgi:predicted dehydrogenase
VSRAAPVRSGIIGAGFMGEVHARAVRAAGGVVAGVAAADAEASVVGAKRLNAAWAAPSVADLLESDEIDLVHICTPNAHHVPIAEHAIKAGKAIICEKPLALTAEEAKYVTELAVSEGIVTGVPFVYRFYPTVRDARLRIGRGDTGSLKLLHGSYLQDWLSNADESNWRVDASIGGHSRAFADIGVHWCDLMEFVTGHRIARVSARFMTAFPFRGDVAVATEDAATVQFETDHGAIGSVVVSQVTPGRKNRLHFSFDGADQSIAFDQEFPESLWVGRRASNEVVMRGSATHDAVARYSVLPPGHPQGYQDCFNAFVSDVHRRIGGDDVDGLPDFHDGLRAARVIDAVIESTETGNWVEVAA